MEIIGDAWNWFQGAIDMISLVLIGFSILVMAIAMLAAGISSLRSRA